MKRNRNRFRDDNKDSRKYCVKYPLSGLLVCLKCGEAYKRRQWTQGYKEPRIMYQCGGYIFGKKKKCANKHVSADVIDLAVCDLINNIYLSKAQKFNDFYEKIKANIHDEGDLAQKNALKKERDKIQKEIDEILSKKGKATTNIEHALLDKKYRDRLSEYQEVDKVIRDLENKEKESRFSKARLEKIKDLLAVKQITPADLTTQIVEACIKGIIVQSKHDIVIAISPNDKLKFDDIKEHRKEIVNFEPIFQNDVFLERRYKPEFLAYKVVACIESGKLI